VRNFEILADVQFCRVQTAATSTKACCIAALPAIVVSMVYFPSYNMCCYKVLISIFSVVSTKLGTSVRISSDLYHSGTS
jgi:hypothetical protein